MDRDRIERRDFPTGRRGYDPAAVDEHLRRLADEFEARAHAPAPSMAESTSEQVRLILAAAERGAAEMRATAGTEASEHVARVQAAADGMLGKLDALESELSRLLSALRTSGERLVEGLAELQSAATLGEAPAAAGDARDPRGAALPGAVTPPVPAPADGDAAGRSPEHPPSRAKPGSGDRLDASPEQAPSAGSPSAGSPGADAPTPLATSAASSGADSPSAESPSADAPAPLAASAASSDADSPSPVAARPDSPGADAPTPLAASAASSGADSPSPVAASPDSPGADSPSPVAGGSASPSHEAESPDSPTPATRRPTSPEPAAESAAHESPPLSAPGAPDWPAPAEALFDAPPAEDSLFAPPEPDEAGARLIALNMALGGSPRDDTRIFLEEHFELPDIEALLDDVYARAGR